MARDACAEPRAIEVAATRGAARTRVEDAQNLQDRGRQGTPLLVMVLMVLMAPRGPRGLRRPR